MLSKRPPFPHPTHTAAPGAHLCSAPGQLPPQKTPASVLKEGICRASLWPPPKRHKNSSVRQSASPPRRRRLQAQLCSKAEAKRRAQTPSRKPVLTVPRSGNAQSCLLSPGLQVQCLPDILRLQAWQSDGPCSWAWTGSHGVSKGHSLTSRKRHFPVLYETILALR